jgi:hypothetical protein
MLAGSDERKADPMCSRPQKGEPRFKSAHTRPVRVHALSA